MTAPEDENLAAKIERLRADVYAIFIGVVACLFLSTATLAFLLLTAPRR